MLDLGIIALRRSTDPDCGGVCWWITVREWTYVRGGRREQRLRDHLYDARYAEWVCCGAHRP